MPLESNATQISTGCTYYLWWKGTTNACTYFMIKMQKKMLMENESNKAVAEYFSHLSERVMQCNNLMGSIQLIYQVQHPSIDFDPLSNNLQPDI